MSKLVNIFIFIMIHSSKYDSEAFILKKELEKRRFMYSSISWLTSWMDLLNHYIDVK